MFDSAAQMFFMSFVVDSDVVVVKVYERSFFVSGKKVIFSVVVHSFERLYRIVVKSW